MLENTAAWWDALQEHCPVTAPDLARITGAGLLDIRSWLDDMEAAGRAVPVRLDRGEPAYVWLVPAEPVQVAASIPCNTVTPRTISEMFAGLD
jgi:hypothetical protein